MDAAALTPESMSERLAAWIAGQIGAAPADVAVHGLKRLAGGASRETWAFELAVKGGYEGADRKHLVLRRDPPGRGGDGDRSLEFRVVRAAHGAGVPVPRPHFACVDPEVLGTSFYVMDFEAGEALARRLLRDDRYAGAREKMTAQLAQIAARIHAIPLEGGELAGLAGPPAGRTAAEAELERVAQGVASLAAEPHPVLDLAERWLRARLPARARTTLVHGDFRVGNVLFDENGARAMLDWELCKRGDPVEDLGWLCTRAWRFGSDALPAGGIGTREELLAAYRAAGGGEIDPEHLRFWEAMGSYKVALVFIQQSWVYLSGKVPSLELASLGRRTAEAEQELVRLMEETP